MANGEVTRFCLFVRLFVSFHFVSVLVILFACFQFSERNAHMFACYAMRCNEHTHGMEYSAIKRDRRIIISANAVLHL